MYSLIMTKTLLVTVNESMGEIGIQRSFIYIYILFVEFNAFSNILYCMYRDNKFVSSLFF